MPKIRIPKETWFKSWKALLQEGAITQVSEDCYIVSARHIQILKEKQLPFEEVKAVVSPREKIRHLLASSIQ
jgi:hypothetical protein